MVELAQAGARNVGGLLTALSAELKSSDTARLDAEVLLAHCLGVDRAALYRAPERSPTGAELEHLRILVDKRRLGCPIPQLTGHAEFWSLKLEIDAYVLVPRPETEHLVEQALAQCGSIEYPVIADLGTGSGAVALAIASERPTARLLASDCCRAALAVAQRNAARLQLNNVGFLNARWLNSCANQCFDLIVSNPPYVESDDPCLAQSSLRFEPILALDGGESGLDAYQRIVPDAMRALKPGGCLIVEHGSEQGSAVRRLFSNAGYLEVRTACDFGGRERITLGINSSPGQPIE